MHQIDQDASQASVAKHGGTCGISSFGRAIPCQGIGREFESLIPLHISKGSLSSQAPFLFVRSFAEPCQWGTPSVSGQGLRFALQIEPALHDLAQVRRLAAAPETNVAAPCLRRASW